MREMTANEWRFWPEREDAVLQKQTALGVYDSHPLTATGGAVKRRAPTWKEMTASAGAVTARNLVWLLPSPNLPEGVTPRAGDQIRASETTGEEINHTILEAQTGKFGNTHRCVTIALAVVYELSALGVLTRPDNTQDAAGRAALTNYSAVGSVRCRVQPSDSQTGEAFGRVTIPRKFNAVIETPLAIQAHDVFTVTTYASPGGRVAGTQAYTVLGFHNPERLDQLMSLDLELIT
jgi:hypothetical protein